MTERIIVPGIPALLFMAPAHTTPVAPGTTGARRPDRDHRVDRLPSRPLGQPSVPAVLARLGTGSGNAGGGDHAGRLTCRPPLTSLSGNILGDRGRP